MRDHIDSILRSATERPPVLLLDLAWGSLAQLRLTGAMEAGRMVRAHLAAGEEDVSRGSTGAILGIDEPLLVVVVIVVLSFVGWLPG